MRGLPFGDHRDRDLAILQNWFLPGQPDPVLPRAADQGLTRPIPASAEDTGPPMKTAPVDDVRRDGTVVEAVEQALERLETKGQALGAVQHLLTDSALKAAEQSDEQIRNGRERVLEGIPFGIKDIIQIAGEPTTFGSPSYASFTSDHTATAVTRLIRAGAIPVAKLRTYEFAAGPNQLTNNPVNPNHMSGGSSSGSAAAVGAGLVPFALGTDTGGSVRVPAAWCGVVGFKPTFGWVSRHGVAPLSWTLDHVGVLAQTAALCRPLLAALTGPDPLDPYSAAPAPPVVAGGRPRVGILRGWADDAGQPAVLAAVERAGARLRDLGSTVVDIDLDIPDGLNPDIVKHVLVAAEAASLHEGTRRLHGRAFAGVLETGRHIVAPDYLRALRARPVLQEAVAHAFEVCDVLISATCPITAPPVGTETIKTDAGPRPLSTIVARYSSLFNITGSPAVSMPYGIDDDGLPVGVQLVGRHWSDDQLLAVASQAFDTTPAA